MQKKRKAADKSRKESQSLASGAGLGLNVKKRVRPEAADKAARGAKPDAASCRPLKSPQKKAAAWERAAQNFYAQKCSAWILLVKELIQLQFALCKLAVAPLEYVARLVGVLALSVGIYNYKDLAQFAVVVRNFRLHNLGTLCNLYKLN